MLRLVLIDFVVVLSISLGRGRSRWKVVTEVSFGRVDLRWLGSARSGYLVGSWNCEIQSS